ncbi:MBL fold metallo-hydrolase [Nocardia pseudovaccinii]|uniref:MBL fold metallo-hydrolase n=1 Tax=Nocardia pseudovaccinii TaxID=189540 RepID=UPI0007A41DC7|nr:MBL fold metallo-hydrolase [Nocardia pseudovaccinii]
MKVGDLEIQPVWDGTMVFNEPPGFPPHDSKEFAPHSRYITSNAEFHADVGGFLIRSGDQLVLVDAGLGPSHDGGIHRPADDPAGVQAYADMFRRFGMPESEVALTVNALDRQSVRCGSLPESLRGLGVHPRDITDVVVSHMHPDHMGWVSAENRSTFPNAQIWVHSADSAYYLEGDPTDETGFRVLLGVPSMRDRMSPAKNQIKLWTNDTHVAPGILLRHLPGHTPGNAIAVVSSAGETAYILGDTFHCAMELIDPTFHIRGDLDPELALRQKDVIRKEIEDGNFPAASSHFPGLSFGRIVTYDRSRTWTWVD